MKTENYKGFTNHRTYTVNQEVLKGEKFNKRLDAYSVELIVEALLGQSPELVWDYAMAYLNDVDYEQLADIVNDQLELKENA
tara:strand:+ start:344 stop:589 length:246 start_codon:yes stop_codon:yes gene_type:complete